MTTRNVVGIAILVLAVAVSVQSVQQNNAAAQQQQSVQQANSSTSSSTDSFQYARLTVADKGEKVTWLTGGNDRVRTESLGRVFRRLGGNASRIDLANLLDQIGSQGWQLVQRDGDTWIFMRRAS